MLSSEGALFWGWKWGKFRNRCALRTPQLAKEPCLLLLYLSPSILLYVLSPFLSYSHPCLSRFQLCWWSPGRRCEMYVCVCGREWSRKGSMLCASGFSGVDAGGSWVRIVPSTLTAPSVAWRLVYWASRHWRHLSVSRVTSPINKGKTQSCCGSRRY